MKELFLKKRAEVEEICKKSHMDMPYQTEMDKIMNLIMSGGSSQLDAIIFPVSSALTNMAIWGINEQEMLYTMIY
jgi:hypothetical protein